MAMRGVRVADARASGARRHDGRRVRHVDVVLAGRHRLAVEHGVRALGNLIGNCVATVAVAAWEGDID
ncbi:MAG: hypothetical protein F9K44_12075, partial [Hyphomicrobiaceae bacterium]